MSPRKPFYLFRLLFAHAKILPMGQRWCTVTTTNPQGRRYSLDILASSTFDAAHLYVTHAKTHPESHIPIPTRATVFEVVAGARVYKVTGTALQRWIEQRRQDWKGPKGFLFAKRPTLE